MSGWNMVRQRVLELMAVGDEDQAVALGELLDLEERGLVGHDNADRGRGHALFFEKTLTSCLPRARALPACCARRQRFSASALAARSAGVPRPRAMRTDLES